MAAKKTGDSAPENIARRSLNSKLSFWHFDYVQSIKSEYHDKREEYASKVKELKEKVRMMMLNSTSHLAQLQQIDMLQRLGLSYQFEDEIKHILKSVSCCLDSDGSDVWKDNLYATVLKFRLLRQHRFYIPQEVFNAFKDEAGRFKACICDDAMGMLSLYEASFHLVHGETILEEAREFSTKNLREFISQNKDENHLSKLIVHALEIPLHWRAPRLEARWFIDLCKRSHDVDSTLLDLAKLDFNLVQSIHQEELKELSRWWKQLGLGQKMSFSRDRLPENYLWATGMVHEPQLEYCRRMSTKIFAILTIIDDVFDVYGKLHELELFTDAFESWNMNAMDQLPDYMKICFLAVYNFTNEVAYHVLKEQGFHILKYLRKAWADLSKGFLREAKWCYDEYTPSFQEYIENAWISITVPTFLVLAYFFVANPITNEALELLEEYPSIIRQSSLICRLVNDLSTSQFELKRGDATPKSIQCYMQETGATEDEARQHIKSFIDQTWKQLNKDRTENSPFSRTFIDIVVNLVRITMWMYE
uniref:Linalool synthase n=1 Tax=Ficus carica TaxID=3494 RepID=A0A7L7S5P2_FICCA|nr:linalool synthase [Ficus carica]